jgi:hypothetical protein
MMVVCQYHCISLAVESFNQDTCEFSKIGALVAGQEVYQQMYEFAPLSWLDVSPGKMQKRMATVNNMRGKHLRAI